MHDCTAMAELSSPFASVQGRFVGASVRNFNVLPCFLSPLFEPFSEMEMHTLPDAICLLS